MDFCFSKVGKTLKNLPSFSHRDLGTKMASSETSIGNRKSLGNQEMELNKKSRNQKIEEKDK